MTVFCFRQEGGIVMEEKEKKELEEEAKKEAPVRGEDEKSTSELEQFIEEQGIQLRY